MRPAANAGQRLIEATTPALFKQRPVARESWDTSSEWLDLIRAAIRDCEEALGVRPDDR